MFAEIENYSSALMLFLFICGSILKFLIFRKIWKRMKRVNKFTSNQRLDGKVAVITGGSDGLGLAISADLVQRGAVVYILSRSETKLADAANYLQRFSSTNTNVAKSVETKNRVICCQIDISDFDSVIDFVRFFKQNEAKIDVLINNAGLITSKPRLSSNGVDLVMATNYLGHFLLTELLLNECNATTIINTTSDMSSLFGNLDVSNPGAICLSRCQKSINFNNLFYMNYSYAMSKKAIEMYCQHFMTSLSLKQRSRMFCANPGLLNTNFSSNWPLWMSKLLKPLLVKSAMKRPEDGVNVILKCLISPEHGDKGGLVYKGVKSYKSNNHYSDIDCELLYKNTRTLLNEWLQL